MQDATPGVTSEEYILKLFVTGMSVASVTAIENIKFICEEYLKNHYTLEIIDIHKNPDLLRKYDVIACPTLIKECPGPYKKLIGNFSDKEKVINGLGIRIQ